MYEKNDQGGQIGGRGSCLCEQCPKVNDYFVQTKITICSHFGQEKKDFIKGKRGLQFWDFPPKIQFVKEWLPEQWCRVSLVDSAMAKCIVLCTAYRLPWVRLPKFIFVIHILQKNSYFLFMICFWTKNILGVFWFIFGTNLGIKIEAYYLYIWKYGKFANLSSINRVSEILKFCRFILDLNQKKLGWLRFVKFHGFQHLMIFVVFSLSHTYIYFG